MGDGPRAGYRITSRARWWIGVRSVIRKVSRVLVIIMECAAALYLRLLQQEGPWLQARSLDEVVSDMRRRIRIVFVNVVYIMLLIIVEIITGMLRIILECIGFRLR